MPGSCSRPGRARQSWRTHGRLKARSNSVCTPGYAWAAASPPPPEEILMETWLQEGSVLAQRGKPHRAIAALLRILCARECAEDSISSRARIALDDLLATQRPLFESLVPRADGNVKHPPASSEARPAVKQRNCIYRISAGLLLFRNGVPARAAPVTDASFPVSAAAPWYRVRTC